MTRREVLDYLIVIKRRLPLRKKIETKPSFLLNFRRFLKIIKDHHRKYDGIDLILESNPEILEAFHNDLKDFGSMKGRESKFCSEQILRLALVKGVEGDPYREAIIRVDGSDFLRNFCRFGMGELPNFTFFCEALKCIKPETLKAMNALLLK